MLTRARVCCYRQKQGAQTAVLAVGGGGTLLSALFFQENLKRLFIKISSGGERSGYDEIPVRKWRRFLPKTHPARATVHAKRQPSFLLVSP